MLCAPSSIVQTFLLSDVCPKGRLKERPTVNKKVKYIIIVVVVIVETRYFPLVYTTCVVHALGVEKKQRRRPLFFLYPFHGTTRSVYVFIIYWFYRDSFIPLSVRIENDISSIVYIIVIILTAYPM